MIRRPPRSTRTDTLFPYPTLFRSVELHALTVPRQRHIGRMAVHPRRRQHMPLIDRHALRFVDGRGIAMIDMGIVLEVERHLSASIEPHRHAVGRHPLDLPPLAALHAYRSEERRVGTRWVSRGRSR